MNRGKDEYGKGWNCVSELIEETKNEWTLKILHDMMGGNFETQDIPLKLLNYDMNKALNSIKHNELFSPDRCAFKDSIGYY